jgi:hypothetical protein
VCSGSGLLNNWRLWSFINLLYGILHNTTDTFNIICSITPFLEKTGQIGKKYAF